MIVTVTPNPVVDLTLTVPHITLNTIVRATGSRQDWGGKGFNVSRALRALGRKSTAMGFIGGATGTKLEHGLHKVGITTNLVRIAGETRTNVVIADASGERFIKVNTPGPRVSMIEMETFLSRVRGMAQKGDLWALCGSLPPGLPDDFYGQLTRQLKAVGARVLLDTSGMPLRLGMAAMPFAVKPNIDEAATLLGEALPSPAAAAAAVERFLDQGIMLVALSMGADGLLLASRDSRAWIRPPEVKIRNAVGAGDALVAGLIDFLSTDAPLPDMGRWAVAAGTCAAMHEGVSVCARDEVTILYKQVTVVPWPGD